jgi:hypothetical protein
MRVEITNRSKLWLLKDDSERGSASLLANRIKSDRLSSSRIVKEFVKLR